MKEIWKDIKGYEGIYQVSNTGMVKSLERKVKNKHGFRTVRERILLQPKGTHGYCTVHLGDKTYLTHRLVAKAFIPNRLSYGLINHKDSNRCNNNFLNLEWCNHLQNSFHAKKKGRMAVKLTERDVKDIKLLLGFVTQKEIAKRFNVNQYTISKIKRGITWDHV